VAEESDPFYNTHISTLTLLTTPPLLENLFYFSASSSFLVSKERAILNSSQSF